MVLSKDEKKHLLELVKRELVLFKKEANLSAARAALPFLKAEHEYGHFLERLMEKLQ